MAIALTLAAAAAMGAGALPWEAAVLAAAGTLCVYNVDRLRDLEADRATAPRRSAFVERFERPLRMAVLASAALGVVVAIRLGPTVIGLCGGVAVVGLLHRRLKHVPVFKGLYVTGAWLVVTVGVPAVVLPDAANVAWVSCALAGPILGNLVVSSLRDRESVAARVPPARVLRAAQLATAVGGALALLGPAQVRPLAFVAACSYLTLLRFRAGERYGMGIVDGSLAIGGFAAVIALK